MSKNINVEDAKDWSDEEASLNVAYLASRGRTEDIARVTELRGKAPAPADENTPPTGTVDEVLDWVGDDAARAQAALDVENDSEKPRVSLVDALEAKIPE